MKKIYFLVAMFLLFSNLFSQNVQDHYYYLGNNRSDLVPSHKYVNIVTSTSFQSNQLDSLGVKNFALNNFTYLSDTLKITRLEFIDSELTSLEFNNKLNSLRQISQIKNIGLYYETGFNSEPVGTSNIFYVQLHKESDYELLESHAVNNNVMIIRELEWIPNWYLLAVNNPNSGSAVQLSNLFFETGLFASVDPGFMLKFSTSSSLNNISTPELSQAGTWGLYNSEDNLIDINICEAWSISEGENTKVAVVDTGIELNHTDLQNNMLGVGYDCITGGGNIVYSQHGTAVAGIVGALKNGIGAVGVAPQSKLVSVSHSMVNIDEPDNPDNYLQGPGGLPGMTEQIASGINWAVNNQNVDIVNNSWGISSVFNIQSNLLNSTINNSLVNGRNGKGSVFVFGSGNDASFGGGIIYPATSNDDNLVVGAIRKNGQRVPDSCFGEKLDVMAPGEELNIFTTGTNNSYTSFFGYTSAAAPYVSGIASLVLSVNPCLTRQQVVEIIERTAQKIRTDLYNYETHPNRPNGTWNNEMGYGLVDAHAAVLMAQSQEYGGTVNLMVRDNLEDVGAEPHVVEVTWESPDIWIRNQADNGLEHQNPIQSATNYVYVRVKNISSCASSSISDKLVLHWSKASSSMSWPNDWDGFFLIMDL